MSAGRLRQSSQCSFLSFTPRHSLARPNITRNISKHGSIAGVSTPFSTRSGMQRYLAALPILDDTSPETFCSQAFQPERPVQLPRCSFAEAMPAVHKWFHFNSEFADSSGNGAMADTILNAEYLSVYGDSMVPMEMTTLSHHAGGKTDVEFTRNSAPLSLFLSLLSRTPPSVQRHQVYIAQAPLVSLPTALQQDVPPPTLVTRTGRGEIYDSSIWLGVAPTYTPLHRDPNPNLFVQLAGRKIVRIFRPEVGRELWEEAVGAVRQSDQMSVMTEGGEEMMQGTGRKCLEEVVWQMRWNGPCDAVQALGYEAVLGPGDAMFIPKGWWHSIKGVGSGVVGSVNWWFR